MRFTRIKKVWLFKLHMFTGMWDEASNSSNHSIRVRMFTWTKLHSLSKKIQRCTWNVETITNQYGIYVCCGAFHSRSKWNYSLGNSRLPLVNWLIYNFSNILFSARSIFIRCWWRCWACTRCELSNSCWLSRLLPCFIFQIFSLKERFTHIL